ncbi:hypothetical protein EK0264_02725 [Epidermidibacterium keratini]|uniref:Uncharacterized protein n=1 Tax=Epidermidibacterium keratini TaxID=1891644 RepID=A0A7L4YJ16_9ACTN|nr:hypothetical protein [Epidermidibacterium keratini]QHB99310.1 hypothetical protein EK0264_02725 [Epidermidibacterium keratini]
MAYAYTNMTSALGDRGSPLRQYLYERFPHRRSVQRAYRESAGHLLVASRGADPALAGAAFDFGVRYTLRPRYVDEMMFIGLAGDQQHVAAVLEVAQVATRSATDGDDELLARACWALGLTTEVYRAGRVSPTSPLYQLIRRRRFTANALLDLASHDAVQEVGELLQLADARLYPSLVPSEPVLPGPRFDASALVAADADLIVGDQLVELKTRLGVRRTDNSRADTLSGRDFYQVIAYALLDTSDEYAVRRLALYSARYGHLAQWDLTDLLNEMAGAPINVAAERERVWALLGG